MTGQHNGYYMTALPLWSLLSADGIPVRSRPKTLCRIVLYVYSNISSSSRMKDHLKDGFEGYVSIPAFVIWKRPSG